MSRIGRQPIPVPAGVTVSIEPELVTVNGPKGELRERINRDIKVEQVGEDIVVTRPTNRGEHRALHGLTRTLVANMVTGVSTGFRKDLELVGVGYRAQKQGEELVLTLGFSHPVRFRPPEGIGVEVADPTHFAITGSSKEQVGQVAADLRRLRPPEPYKGKGLMYRGERIRRKPGKSGKGAK
jgi:large subunit ribosomal protein L6